MVEQKSHFSPFVNTKTKLRTKNFMHYLQNQIVKEYGKRCSRAELSHPAMVWLTRINSAKIIFGMLTAELFSTPWSNIFLVLKCHYSRNRDLNYYRTSERCHIDYIWYETRPPLMIIVIFGPIPAQLPVGLFGTKVPDKSAIVNLFSILYFEMLVTDFKFWRLCHQHHFNRSLTLKGIKQTHWSWKIWIQ